MTKKNNTKRKARKTVGREMEPWENSNNEDANLYHPAHLRMLCSLMGVSIEKMIEDFIITLSGSFNSLGERLRHPILPTPYGKIKQWSQEGEKHQDQKP